MSEPGPLDLMQYLPGLFREQHVETEFGLAFRRDGEQAGADGRPDPLRAIVEVYERTAVERVERILNELPQAFQPDTAVSAAGWPIADFLGMLARWVALDADDVATYGRLGRARAERKLRFLVKNAAAIHAAHGTPHGLRYILEILCDAEVEVLEWSWPRGFDVGLASSIGIDTFLTGQPDVAHCLTVIWKVPLPTGEGPEVQWLETPCRSRLGERRVLSRIVAASEGRAASELDVRLARMKRLLALERPAHVASYLALEPAEEPARAPAAVFVVEVTSAAGYVWIETAG